MSCSHGASIAASSPTDESTKPFYHFSPCPSVCLPVCRLMVRPPPSMKNDFPAHCFASQGCVRRKTTDHQLILLLLYGLRYSCINTNQETRHPRPNVVTNRSIHRPADRLQHTVLCTGQAPDPFDVLRTYPTILIPCFHSTLA